MLRSGTGPYIVSRLALGARERAKFTSTSTLVSIQEENSVAQVALVFSRQNVQDSQNSLHRQYMRSGADVIYV
jgi:hypothetical protein